MAAIAQSWDAGCLSFDMPLTTTTTCGHGAAQDWTRQARPPCHVQYVRIGRKQELGPAGRPHDPGAPDFVGGEGGAGLLGHMIEGHPTF
eukprot:353460-Chlamydomonas_euryale.AAC.9